MADPRHRLRRRMVLTLATLVMLLVVSLALARTLVGAIDVGRQEVAYGAAEELIWTEALSLSVQERAAASRGYLLSGAGEFLESRRSAQENAVAAISTLKSSHASEQSLAQVRRIEDLDTRLVEASDRAIERWGDSPAEAVLAWDRDVRPLQNALDAALRDLARDQRLRFDAARRRAEEGATWGKRMLLLVGGFVLAATCLLAVQFVRTARELSERVQGEQEQAMFRILDQVPVGILVVRSDGKPYFTNQRARRMLGRDSAQASSLENFTDSQSAYQTGRDERYPAERIPLVRALQGETSEVTDLELRHEADVIPLHAQGGPVYDGDNKLAYGVMAFQDVRELQRLSMRDALTGLQNRAALSQTFGRERLLAERLETVLSLGVIDLDRFKAVNDTYGHAMGDQVLKRFATVTSDVLRRTDILGRWGGEEFVVLFPNTDAIGARTALEKALAVVGNETFATGDRMTFNVTFSAGIVVLRRGETLEGAVARADTLLYAAKAAGRNRILSEDPRETSALPESLAPPSVKPQVA